MEALHVDCVATTRLSSIVHDRLQFVNTLGIFLSQYAVHTSVRRVGTSFSG